MSRLQSSRPRVFCIGWHKTGTTTLGLALIKLGYSVLGCRLDMVHPLRAGNTETVLDLAGRFDALQDVPWAALYRELDDRFPGSRFILTVREEQKWLESAARHFRDVNIPLHEWLYGTGRLIGNEALYLERYREHNSAVKVYFRNRKEDLLIMNLERGDGWETLCTHLNCKAPAGVFPHENKATHRMSPKERFKRRAMKIVSPWLRENMLDWRARLKSRRGVPDPRNRFNNFRENRAERDSWLEMSSVSDEN
jgi:hypothetical protein